MSSILAKIIFSTSFVVMFCVTFMTKSFHIFESIIFLVMIDVMNRSHTFFRNVLPAFSTKMAVSFKHFCSKATKSFFIIQDILVLSSPFSTQFKVTDSVALPRPTNFTAIFRSPFSVVLQFLFIHNPYYTP